MNKYASNGINAELAQYETPFADISVQKEAAGSEESYRADFSNYLQQFESPFSRTYEAASLQTGLTPAGEEYVQFLGDMEDQEFTNILHELASDLEDSWLPKISNEAAMGGNYIPFATQNARQYFSPILNETDQMIDRISQHFSTNNLADHSETEIESFFSNLEFNHSQFSPAQEQFLGGIFNKVKNVVKKGIDLAKKGVSAVGKILPLNILLDRIKGLVRPLLDRVLKFAIGKLPKNLQPHAQNLAKKFLNLETNSNGQADSTVAESGDQMSAIQSEFDRYVAQLVFSPSESETENVLADYENSYENLERSLSYETGQIESQPSNEARRQFIDELKALRSGESPAPAIERFLPVALMAVQPVIKMAISMIGRERVINFLAGLLAKLVGKYVPQDVAQPLAASIIGTGMSLIGFETSQIGDTELAYEAITNTIEETVQNLDTLDEAVLNDQEMMTMHLLEAFEKAVANNFPPQYIRPDLRVSKKPGVWVQMPRRGPSQLYKKFTGVFDITIDPQSASTITTFRGLPLANFLRDKYGLDTSKPIQAKVHLFEATVNTRLYRISKYENLPGLNAKQPKAWVQLQPLTKQAAGILLKEPALGKDIDSKSLTSRYKVKPGDRFYFLEINGVRLRIPQINRANYKFVEGGKPVSSMESRSADIQGVINFLKSEIKFNYFFSEEDAKAVVEKLNRNDHLGAAMTVRQSIRNVLNNILVKNVATKVKIIHEAMPELYLEHYDDHQEQFAPLAALGRLAGKEIIAKLVEKLVEKLASLAYDALANFFKARAAEFKQAQALPLDGVTVVIKWSNIPRMNTIRAAINAIRGNLSVGNLTDIALPNLPVPEILVSADKKFD